MSSRHKLLSRAMSGSVILLQHGSFHNPNTDMFCVDDGHQFIVYYWHYKMSSVDNNEKDRMDGRITLSLIFCLEQPPDLKETTKFSYVPLASFHFRAEQLQLSTPALKELKITEEQLEHTDGPD
ncbi:hypothetical protein STEG23_029618 [Scotinomys teguina]